MTTSSSAFKRFHKTPPTYITEDKKDYAGYDPYISRRYLEFLKPYALQVWISLILITVASVAVVFGPVFVRMAIDDGLAKGSVPALRQAVLLYLGAASFQWFATFIRVNIMVRVGQGMIYDLRGKLFEHLQDLSLNFYSRYSVGRIISRVINDVNIARRFITWAMLATVRDVFTLGGILIAMLVMSTKLSLISFMVLPLMIGATILFRRRAREAYRKVRLANSWVNSVLAENINGVRVVQAFVREKLNFGYFSEIVNKYNLESNLFAEKLASIFFPTVDLLGSIATGLVIWIGGAAVFGEELTPGILVAFLLYVEQFFNPIRNLSQRYDMFQATMAGGERIFELLDRKIEVRDERDAKPLPVIKGDVRFDNVTFHYEAGGETVLNNIDLDIPAGSTVALVGQTGAGKSTLVKLLSRFHDPTEGTVLVDNIDLRTTIQASLRNQMGIVLQEPFLFSGSVRENIRFGNLKATDEAIEAAAKAVGAHEFISNLRDGYDTSVAEGGVMLSVGQRQLVSFARALLANPRILILDEATSSVDTQTEQVIQEALETLLQGRTSFVIAHRLSTIVKADKIVVMDKGEIIEMGTHDELLEVGGTYFHLYKMGFADENTTS